MIRLAQLLKHARLFTALDRPNVMIKVPATPAGIPAIQALIGDGININVTLIFALSSYEAVAEAYITGLEMLAAKGGDVSRIASVASFFISRVDSAVDTALEKIGHRDLLGRNTPLPTPKSLSIGSIRSFVTAVGVSWRIWVHIPNVCCGPAPGRRTQTTRRALS